MRLQGGENSHLRLTRNHEDFELKKALICILGTFSADRAAVKVEDAEVTQRELLFEPS